MIRYKLGLFGREKEDENGDWVRFEEAESEIKCRDKRVIMMIESNERYRRLKKICTNNMAKLIDEYHRSEQEVKQLRAEEIKKQQQISDLNRLVMAFAVADVALVAVVLIGVALQ